MRRQNLSNLSEMLECGLKMIFKGIVMVLVSIFLLPFCLLLNIEVISIKKVVAERQEEE
jgi:hypothetical protein